MKIRNGFVSNSSSSSFICEVSGRIETGMDMCLDDAEMSECVNGHIFSDNYVLGGFDVDSGDEGRYGIPAKYCPICTLDKVSSKSILQYILKSRALDVTTVIDEIRSDFNNFEELETFLKTEK